METEGGERPEGINPYYFKCPKCSKTGDYWQTMANVGGFEESAFACFYCHTIIRIKRNEFGNIEVIGF